MEQELDLLGLMAVFKRWATTCDSKPTQTFGTYGGESDKGQDPRGCSLLCTASVRSGRDTLHGSQGEMCLSDTELQKFTTISKPVGSHRGLLCEAAADVFRKLNKSTLNPLQIKRYFL